MIVQIRVLYLLPICYWYNLEWNALTGRAQFPYLGTDDIIPRMFKVLIHNTTSIILGEQINRHEKRLKMSKLVLMMTKCPH